MNHMDKVTLIGLFSDLTKDISNNAELKGFWDDAHEGLSFKAMKIALMHSELSEALEALRHPDKPDEHLWHHDNLTVELADCVIRIMDFAGHYDLNLIGVILDKNEFNKTRNYKHDKEF